MIFKKIPETNLSIELSLIFNKKINEIESKHGSIKKIELIESMYLLNNHPWIIEAGIITFDLFFKISINSKTIVLKQDDCIFTSRGILISDSLRIVDYYPNTISK